MNRRQFLQKGVFGLAGLVGLVSGCLSHQQKTEFEMLNRLTEWNKPALYDACKDNYRLYVSDPDGLEKVEILDKEGNVKKSFNVPKFIFPRTKRVLKIGKEEWGKGIRIYDSKGNVSSLNNVISSLHMCKDNIIKPPDLPEYIKDAIRAHDSPTYQLNPED